ncbi:MAG: hypothetical protein EA425_12285 [Puniceicoccaceae bacterium]|nr:MAG: hypothetical protein EA425_12285 [Puniceicoccaceae bacterium]
MHDDEFSAKVDQILKEDRRYDRSAYAFLRDALDHTVGALEKKRKAGAGRRRRHVTGQELLGGIRDYALEQFGPMAFTVLTEWGVRSGSDFGEMVYNLIELQVFSKTENDRREDFDGGYDFVEAFVKPFEPRQRRFPLPHLETVDRG